MQPYVTTQHKHKSQNQKVREYYQEMPNHKIRIPNKSITGTTDFQQKHYGTK